MNNENRSAGVNGTGAEIPKERLMYAKSGMPILVGHVFGIIIAIAAIVVVAVLFRQFIVPTAVVGGIYIIIVAPCFLGGIRLLEPNEAFVFTYFGEYKGTLKGPGYFYVNVLHTCYAPQVQHPTTAQVASSKAVKAGEDDAAGAAPVMPNKRISLKSKTINNNKQKVNDLLGNPVIVDSMVIWRIVDTAKAMFSVDNYMEYLSVQCDAALRDIVSLYPYDVPDDSKAKSLRCSTDDIAQALKEEIQAAVEFAGLEIVDARITNLSYAPEIAAAMLQKQQASAVVDAKHTIVEGAVDIVEMALRRLNANDIVKLDEERKAAMVSNLLVVLCGNKDAQPVLNSGSLY